MKRGLTWLLLLIKRQYKHRTFIALLLLVALLVVGYTAVTGGESGVVRVAVCYNDKDELARSLYEKLQGESQLIRFVSCDVSEAEHMLTSGKTDAAWIFPEDTKQAIISYLTGDRDPFIRVVERQPSTSTLLAREKLTAAVLTAASELYYEAYLRENVPELKDAPYEDLMAYYHQVMLAGHLFQFEDTGGRAEHLADQQSYLHTPLRGILGVLAAVGAMASGKYYSRDLAQGVFSWVPERRRLWLELACQLISLTGLLTVSAVSLALAGLNAELWREISLIAAYSLCCAGFGMLFRTVLGSVQTLAVALPLLSIGMMGLCPVFVQLQELKIAAAFLPPTYYIGGDAVGGAIYGAACIALSFVVGRIKSK